MAATGGAAPQCSPDEPFGTVLDLRTTASQNREAVPRRACIQGSWTCASLNSRLESNKEEKEARVLLTRSVVSAKMPIGGLQSFRGLQPFGRNVTKFAPHKALKSIALREVDFWWKVHNPPCGRAPDPATSPSCHSVRKRKEGTSVPLREKQGYFARKRTAKQEAGAARAKQRLSMISTTNRPLRRSIRLRFFRSHISEIKHWLHRHERSEQEALLALQGWA